MLLYVLSHITVRTQGQQLLPALRNSGRLLTIPLNYLVCEKNYFLYPCNFFPVRRKGTVLVDALKNDVSSFKESVAAAHTTDINIVSIHLSPW